MDVLASLVGVSRPASQAVCFLRRWVEIIEAGFRAEHH